MAIQIDRMETSVDISSPASGAPPKRERGAAAEDQAAASSTFRDEVAKVLTDALAEYSRIRGH